MMIRSFQQATAVVLMGAMALCFSLPATEAHGHHHHHHGGLRALTGVDQVVNNATVCYDDDDDDKDYGCARNITEGDGHCGTTDPEEEERLLLLAEDFDQTEGDGGGRYLEQENITIPLHFHIIYRSDRGLFVTNEQVDAQLAHLNEAFAETPFFFVEASRHFLDNKKFYRAKIDSPEEREMKTELRIGGVQDLNVYVKRGSSGGQLGW